MEHRFETFTVLINRISRNIRKIKNQEMAQYNLRSPHISCLYYLYSCNELTATQLCECCEEDKATISRTLNSLEENRYIVSRTQNAKRYNSPLHLTQRGRELGEKIAGKINGVLDVISESLSEEERVAFYRSLTAISQALETVSNKGEKI